MSALDPETNVNAATTETPRLGRAVLERCVRLASVCFLGLVLAWVPEVGATVAAAPLRQTFVRPELGAGAFIPGGDERTGFAAAFRLSHGWAVSPEWQLGGMSSTQWIPADDRAVTGVYAHLVRHEHEIATVPGYRLDMALGLCKVLGDRAATSESHVGPGWLVGFGLPVWSSARPYEYIQLEAGGSEWVSNLVAALSYEGSYTQRFDHAISLTLSFAIERVVIEY